MRSEIGPTIALTGASAGLGAALAEAFSAKGIRLFLAARSRDRLEHVAARCAEIGARVQCDTLDIRDPDAVLAWVERIDAQTPLDVMVLNAGIYGGRPAPGAPEPDNVRQDIIATNLSGTLACAQAIAPRMAARAKGKIVFISSLAAYLPAADAPTYAATKAGVTAYAEAMREDLAGSGVRVMTVHPGHIRTHQTQIHQGRLDFLCEPAAAARAIRRAMVQNREDLSFPQAASLSVCALRWLPRSLRHRLLKSQRFHIQSEAPHGPPLTRGHTGR
jgi:short-subunit dehydrogenase